MPEKIKKLGQFFSVASHSRTLSLLVILLIIAAVPLTVFIAQKQQEIRQRAEPQCREIGGQLLDTGECGNRAPSETCPSTEWDPEHPELGGYKGSEWTWKANDCESPPPTCSDGTCTGGVDNWCYGFECDGPSCQLHCLTLTSIVTPTPTNTPAPPPPTNTPSPAPGQPPPTPTPTPISTPGDPRPTGACGLTPPTCDPASQIESITLSPTSPKVGDDIHFTIKGSGTTCVGPFYGTQPEFKINGKTINCGELDISKSWIIKFDCKATEAGSAVLTYKWKNQPPNCGECAWASGLCSKNLGFQVYPAAIPTPTPTPIPGGLPEGTFSATCGRFKGTAKDIDQPLGIQVDFWLLQEDNKDLKDSVYLGYTSSKSIRDGFSFDVLTTAKTIVGKLVLDNGKPRTVSAYAINEPRDTPNDDVLIGKIYIGSCSQNPDVDRNGCIGQQDAELWLRAYQKIDPSPYRCPAGYTCGEVNYYPDINNDGIINLIDFSFWVKEMVSE